MNKVKYLLVILIFELGSPKNFHAMEVDLFQVSGLDSPEITLEKIGAPANSKPPISFKNKNVNIKVELMDKSELTIDLSPPQPFSLGNQELFERIETSSPADIHYGKLLIADPKTGRIFHLNRDLKITKMDVIKPWATKSRLKNLKNILEEMSKSPAIKKEKN